MLKFLQLPFENLTKKKGENAKNSNNELQDMLETSAIILKCRDTHWRQNYNRYNKSRQLGEDVLFMDFIKKPFQRMSKILDTTSPAEMLPIDETASYIHENNEEDSEPSALITVFHDEPVEFVLATLSRYKISSCPVIKRETGEVLGFIDILDLVAFCSSKFDTRIHFLSSNDSNRFMERRSEEFLDTEIIHLLTLSRRNQWFEARSGTPLIEIIQNLVTDPKIRRLALVQSEQSAANLLEPEKNVKNLNSMHGSRTNKRRIIGVITQSQIVEFLYENREIFPKSFLHMPVPSIKIREKMHHHHHSKHGGEKNLLFEQPSIHCVSWNETVIDAFRTIWEKEVTGVGVLDRDNRLVGTISASDLKSIDFHADENPTVGLHQLYESVSRFVETTPHKTEAQEDYPIVVKTTDNLERVLHLLVSHRIHRVFVTDDHDKPIDVITLRDILARVVHNFGGHK